MSGPFPKTLSYRTCDSDEAGDNVPYNNKEDVTTLKYEELGTAKR
jgi:hypothetical protein